MRRVVFDTETTGLFRRNAQPSDTAEYDGARVLQIAYVVCDEAWRELRSSCYIVSPGGEHGFVVDGTQIHGITSDRAVAEGVSFKIAVEGLFSELEKPNVALVAHNAEFDMNVLVSELYRRGHTKWLSLLETTPVVCTMQTTTDLLKLPGRFGYKWPRLEELYRWVTGEAMTDAHDALRDCQNLCYALRTMKAQGITACEPIS